MNKNLCMAYTALVALMVCSGCSNQNAPHQYTYQAGETATIASITLPGNNAPARIHADHRPQTGGAYTAEDLTPLKWDATDKLSVFAYKERGASVTVTKADAPFTLASGAGTAQATFTGVMPAETDDYFVVCASGQNHAVTTDKQGSTYKMTVTGVEVPSQQTAVLRKSESEAPTFASGLMPLLGLGDKDGFEVVNAGCALRFRMYSTAGETIKQVRIFANGVNLTGTASYDYNYDKSAKTLTLSHKATAGAANEVILNMPEGGYTLPNSTKTFAEEEGQYFYFVMPAPVSMPNAFVLYVTLNDGTTYYKDYTSKGSVEIGFNQIYTLNPTGAIEFDKTNTTVWKQ